MSNKIEFKTGMTASEKNQLVEQYEPLVNKLTAQYFKSVKCPWDDIQSYAYEGLAIAINKYDPSRSSMDFTHYAAFAIRNNILSSLNNELRTVKLDAYAQKKQDEIGGSSFNTISIDTYGMNEDDDTKKAREMVVGTYEDEKFSNGDVFEYLYSRLNDAFPERDCNMFYMMYGLNGFNDTSNKDIAKEFGVSTGLVSQKVRAIIKWIRKDKDLCEMLSELLS